MGMTSGFAVIIAQDYGSGDRKAVCKSIALSVRLSAVMALLLTAIGCLLLKPILHMIQTEEILIADGLTYGYIIMGGLTATVAFNLCSSILRSLGDSKTPFIAIIISSAVNIALDWFLIFIVHTGVEGAAFATIFAQALSAIICLMRILTNPELQFCKEDFASDRRLSLLLLKNGLPMAFMNSVTALGCMVVQRYVNDCGADFTSAYSVCSKYLNLFMLPSLTAGFAVSAFVGQNIGDNTLRDISQAIAVQIKPQLVPTITLDLLDNKNVIKVSAEGSDTPYSAYGKYYIRSADEDRELTPVQLRKIMQEKDDADIITKIPAANQNLTFLKLKTLF